MLSEFQVVERDSAIIDGSQGIGFEQTHREIQRFKSREDHNYQSLLVWIRDWVEKARQEALSKYS